jgi:uncharacterized membrane protein YjjB (DUF3815 family)
MNTEAVSSTHCTVYDHWYTQRPPSNSYILFVLGFSLCLCAINQAKLKQMPVMSFIAIAGWSVNNYSAKFFQNNSTLSSTLGALCIGVLANLYSRLGRFVDNFFLDVWEKYCESTAQRVKRFVQRKKAGRNPEKFVFETPSGAAYPLDSLPNDPEQGIPRKPSYDQDQGGLVPRARKIGYGLAAAAMLPAIFVQVPSGLAVSGSLLSGITTADSVTRNETIASNGTIIANGTVSYTSSSTDLSGTAFNVLLSVIQVAISISVGLSLSALIVYPLGKRRSGLFSF